MQRATRASSASRDTKRSVTGGKGPKREESKESGSNTKKSKDDEDGGDEDNNEEYGLRRRNRDGKSGLGLSMGAMGSGSGPGRRRHNKEPLMSFDKGWSVPPLPEKGEIRGLTKSQIKKDLKMIERTVEPDILEDMSARCDGEQEWASFVVQRSLRGATDVELNARSGIFLDDEGEDNKTANRNSGNKRSGRDAKGGGKIKKNNRTSTNSNSSSSSSHKDKELDSDTDSEQPKQERTKADQKKGSRPMADIRRAFTQTKRLGSTNFYFPFKKMKDWDELHDYLDFVNEQTYLSARNAFVQKMAMLTRKREQQNEVLSSLYEVYTERLSTVMAMESGIRETAPLLDKVIQHVAYYKERADLATKELETYRANAAYLNSSTSSINLDDPSITPRSRNRSRSRSNPSAAPVGEAVPMDTEGGEEDTKTDVDRKKSKNSEDNESTHHHNLNSAHKIAELRCVHTPYGSGVLHDVRPDGFAMIKLEWGATAFLKLSTLSQASLDHLAEREESLRDTIEALVTETREPTEVNRRPVMYTLPEHGPPRGIPLQLSLLSGDGHFALAPGTPLDPIRLMQVYRSKNLLATPAAKDFVEEQEYEAADLDLREYVRSEDLKQVPFSWGSLDTSPWSLQEHSIPKRTMDVWEKDRSELSILRAKVGRLQRELKETRGSLRLREKLLEDEHKTHALLLAQMHSAQNQTQAQTKVAVESSEKETATADTGDDDVPSHDDQDPTTKKRMPLREASDSEMASPPRKRPRRTRSGSKADLSADDTDLNNGGTPEPGPQMSSLSSASTSSGASASNAAQNGSRSATRRRAQRVS
mmetsp:Transcript_16661/g.32313  ORF Transcript_16661/g.32313 Transcript_16661/m.32313 type:complete len:816 (-) Transcript_16661:292-2739(-)|eukprot:CAMPEP_0171542722 /NCGR_PEP_ID=MMETSP0960-20121227/2521_1 /TAXON_ID=87120 /ORGANISM="Aurantiochytrium limacinum, Strain ATCCMYA-1381" /LENGTH=815 /DNA_ID=CAMNT_0012090287 /DNA_START=525 /DNA_END=2972 /DNA_ORIENTATION=-